MPKIPEEPLQFNYSQIVKHSLLLLKFVNHRLEPISTTAPDASKMTLDFKSGQNWLENSHFTSLI